MNSGGGVTATALAITIALASTGTMAAGDGKVAPLKLTPAEIAEKEARKGCKIKICSAFVLKNAGEDEIACSIVKSWRKEQLTKMVEKARVSWPWGPVRCTAELKLPRNHLIQAMTAAKFDLKLDEHTVSCVVEREKEPATIKFSFAPKVTFEGGKAVKASLNWGKVEAPTVVKAVIWPAKTADNTFNVLQSTIVEDINDFVGKKCPEIKDELK